MSDFRHAHLLCYFSFSFLILRAIFVVERQLAGGFSPLPSFLLVFFDFLNFPTTTRHKRKKIGHGIGDTMESPKSAAFWIRSQTCNIFFPKFNLTPRPGSHDFQNFLFELGLHLLSSFISDPTCIPNNDTLPTGADFYLQVRMV